MKQPWFGFAIVFLIVASGCDWATLSTAPPDVTVETVWQEEPDRIVIPEGMPDFDINAIPTVDVVESGGQEFEISIDVNGQLYRHGEKTTESAVIEELLAIENTADVAVVVTGDADIKVAVLTALQRSLSQSVPELGSVTFVAAPRAEGRE